MVAGTAFAISKTLLLSAMHVVEDDDVPFYICQEVRRSLTGQEVSYPRFRYAVSIIAKGDANVEHLDYVVLSVGETCQHLELQPIPISSVKPKMEDEVKLYYAFYAPGYNQFEMDFCQIAVNSYEKIATVSASHLFTNRGTDSGTSGGPYVTKRGQVVAIHIASTNTVPDVKGKEEMQPKEKNQRLRVADVNAKVEVLSDAVSRISNTYCSNSVGLVITSCRRLCDFLHAQGVVFH